jgi:hypothetical protein
MLLLEVVEELWQQDQPSCNGGNVQALVELEEQVQQVQFQVHQQLSWWWWWRWSYSWQMVQEFSQVV